jgi:hypothetical protein
MTGDATINGIAVEYKTEKKKLSFRAEVENWDEKYNHGGGPRRNADDLLLWE